MVTFRNNNRRNNFRRNGRNDRNFKTGGERAKFGSSFSSNNEIFQRKAPGRNNHNAPKLIEKYNNLAREALSVGDKILSENYFQHADHFTRILNDQETYKKTKISDNSNSLNESGNSIEKKIEPLSDNKTGSSETEEAQSEVS